MLREVIRSGVLFSVKGTAVKRLEQQFAQKLGVKHAFACSSGTAAIHTALAALELEPGDEVITTPITDMGAISPILYQGAIPVFADVDPKTYNLTAATIEARLSGRTRAIIVTHLFGNPCPMSDIMGLARAHKIPVIEDCAQAYLSRSNEKIVGTIGSIGCFSLQQGKHITTGEGGLVVSNDDALARRMFLFINKGWGYGDPKPDHYFLALNYRMSELQGAVGVAQLMKLEAAVEHRLEMAARLTKALAGVRGIETPHKDPLDVHTYWKYCLRIDDGLVEGGAPGLSAALAERGVSTVPRYIQKPAFACEVIREQRTFGKSRWPFSLARREAVTYDPSLFPGTYEALRGVLVVPLNERYEQRHVDYVAQAIREAVEQLGRHQPRIAAAG